MDFGSSHVYAGSSDVYYSSVPKESGHNQGSTDQDSTDDPIYESIDRSTLSRGSKSLTKPKIPEKPSIYRTQSLSDKLREALYEREKQIKSQQANVDAKPEHPDSADQPPLPPRKYLLPTPPLPATPLPATPLPAEDKPENNGEPVYVPRPASKGAPAALIPTLRPPPSSVKRRMPLPPTPNDGVSPTANQQAHTEVPKEPLQPNDHKQMQPMPIAKKSDNIDEEVPWDAVAAPTKTAVPNPYEMNDSGRLYPVLPSLDSMPTVVPSAPQLTGTMVRREAEFLRERLRSSTLIENGSEDNSLTADANLHNEVEVSAGSGNQGFHPGDCRSWTLSLSQQVQTLSQCNPMIRASAPHLSQSMIRRDIQRDVKAPIPQANSPESVYSSADTNVVCVKLGIIGESAASRECFLPPTLCSSCLASTINVPEEWTCKFCGTKNLSSCPQVPPESANDITYVLEAAKANQTNEDSLVVLCIDTSGSMCVTSKVESASGSLFVSRLQGVQYAIYEQLNRIGLANPRARVALVTFSDIVQLLGDGSAGQELTFSDMQLFDYDFLRTVGSTAALPGPISLTRGHLNNAVSNLKERGGTALGPALLLSTALASQKPGSQVIVCTDGRANVGVGSLETESDYQLCHHFYNQTAELASKTGVIVSILSIAGTDCRLVELGKVASKTSGKVSIVEASKISDEFQDILTDTVLATNVSIDLVTHRQLYFSNTEGTAGSSIAQFVGNTTNDSEITFRYGIKRDGEFANVAPPHEAPFQLKIIYRPPDGSVRMRVITQMRPVTESRELAETQMNLGVVGAYASQSAAKLALEGEVDYAKQVTNAHKQLLFRGMSLKSQTGSVADQQQEEKIYDHVKSKIDDIGKELAKVDVGSSTEDLSSPDAIPCEVDVYQDFGESPASPRPSNVPPALPPRGRSHSHAPPSGKLTKVQSLESMLARLPSIPKGPIGKKKKNKKKVAEQFHDETARKMFNFSKATSSRMVGIAE